MALFYSIEPPKTECDFEVVRSSLKERLIGIYEASTDDHVMHFLLVVLATSKPYLKKLVSRIEREMFAERLAKISLACLRKHLRSYLNYLQLDALQRKLPGSVRKTLVIIVHVLETVEARFEHVFDPDHSTDCHFSKLLLPFTFPRTMVAKRLVELVKGKAQVYCGVWKTLLADIFDHLLDIEYAVMQKNKLVFKAIFEGEDDRYRRIIGECAELLGGQPGFDVAINLDAVDEESRYFPPCMSNLHQILRKTHRLSYDSRYQYTVFLKDVGMSLEDNTDFWKIEYSQERNGSSCCHDWKQKSSRYEYQIKHIYGLVGDSTVKFCRTCEIFTSKLSSKMDGGCPFQHSTASGLRRSIPYQLKHIVEPILDLQTQDNPNRACAVYLSSQKPIPGVKSIVSPIQYYNLARSVISLAIHQFFVDEMTSTPVTRFSKVNRSGNPQPPGMLSYSGSETDVSTSTENLSNEERYVIRHTARQEPQGQEHLPASNRSSLDASTCSYNTLIIHHEEGDSKRTSRLLDRSITDIPDDFLSESQVLKHLAKEVKTSPPDESTMTTWRSKGLREKRQMSKSQPDLRHVDQTSSASQRRIRALRSDSGMVQSLQQENARLRSEVLALIQKLSITEKLEQEFGKVHRAQEDLVQSSERRGRLEREARTRLQTDNRRLQEMNRALRDQVELSSAQILSSRVPTSDAFRHEVNKRDVLITQLIASNKELSACKERQEIELAAQRATLQEQRTHIDILDTALTNAQGNVVRLEEECRKKQMYVELVAQLKQALVSQQQASDRREQSEHMLRLQLERELRAERAKSSASDNASGGFGSNASCLSQSGSAMGESVADLKRKLRERDEKIMFLEGENSKWEQRAIEESALRQAAIDAASLPKDAKIAALEKTTQENERMMLEARSEKMRHMDEHHATQKRVADLQSRVKDLESRLAERDAMIKVLHKHTYDKGFTGLSRQDIGPTSSVFSTVSSALTSSTGFTSYSGRSDSSSKLFHSSTYHPATSVSDSGTKLSYHGGDSSSKLSYGGDSSSKLSFGGESYHGGDPSSQIGSYASYRGQYSGGQSFDDTKKSLDDQLKELDSQLDSQLLSKRGLCCFPGFSNPSASPRKGKISQPLLAGVAGLENAGGFLGGLVRATEPTARPEEMMLLEKQGRSSQRQRAGSLPPSSLPRPRRTRKLGEYGRLSDSEAARKTSTDEDVTGSLRYGTDRKYGDYGQLIDADDSCKPRDETIQRPPASPSSFSYGRLKTPPIDARKLDYGRKAISADETPPRPPSTPTKLEYANFPRFKTPPIDGSLSRKQNKEDSPGAPNFIAYGRYKTPPPLEPPKIDLTRFTPPKGKKSFIPPPRKLGDYGRLGARSSSDSSPATPRDSGEQRASSLTPNYRIRF